MKKVLEYINKIDDILASYEDWMHGENAEECMKARKYLVEIENKLKKVKHNKEINNYRNEKN